MDIIYKQGDALLQEINQTSVPDNCLALWNLGQEGYVIKGAKDIICIDPYLSDSIARDAQTPGEGVRDFPPPIDPNRFQSAAAVLCTHYHQDHMDGDTLKAIANASDSTLFVVPASHESLARSFGIDVSRILLAKDMEPLQIGEFTITPVAQKHQEFETDAKGNHFFLGYIVEANGVTLYHSGDTVYFPELVDRLSKYRIDIAMVNSNGRDWMRDEANIIGNMNYREALEFVRAIQADLVIPMHFDMFAGNRENPAYFVDYLFNRHRSQKFHMFAVGERFIYHR